MRTPMLLSLLFGLASTALGGTALAETALQEETAETAETAVAPGFDHRISFGVATLSTRSPGSRSGGMGAGIQLGYDLFFTPNHGVGIVAGAGLDGGSYGADADGMTWIELGARYTFAYLSSQDALFVPFISPGVMFTRTGGELATNQRITSLTADLGLELRAFRHVSFDLRIIDRLGRIPNPYGPVSTWHNSVGGLLSVSVRFPG